MASSLEKKIEEINAKLSDMLTKKDKGFIKSILADTLEELKDKIIGSVLLRVEKLEGDVHETIIGQSKLKKEIEECKTKNTALQDENTKLKNEIKSETESRKEQINSLEQYGRRNNIRVSGLDFDSKYEDAHATSSGIITLFNEKMGLELSAYDIDIAHRLGKYENNKIRPVIVKFVSRQTKYIVMKNTKHLKGTKLSVNEDLTNVNHKVLSSLRHKDKVNVIKDWSFEGKLYIKTKDDKTEVVPYSKFQTWLDKPWPKAKG